MEQLNRIFEGELSDTDMISYAEATVDKVMEDSEVVLQARNNESLDQFAKLITGMVYGKVREKSA